jgi:hypothetical protein
MFELREKTYKGLSAIPCPDLILRKDRRNEKRDDD